MTTSFTNTVYASLLALTVSAGVVGCGSKNSSYALLGSSQSFKQAVQDNRVDVLWMIDNSGSMANSQSNLANNFPSFITNFQNSGFDFKIAVTKSDAYMALPAWTSFYNQNPKPGAFQGGTQAEIAKFRDGNGTTHTGFFVIDNNTPSINSVFMTNIKQGTSGSGDERSFQSFKAALESPLNVGFLRPGAFLAVILVTDEEDFSHDGTQYLDFDWTNPALHTTQSYVDYLDGKTMSSGATRRYSVNSVSIKDQTCLDSLGGTASAKKIAVRVQDLVTKTGGINASICGNFANELENISSSIISLATQFYLNADPVVSTIQVFVDGSQLPANAWTYSAAANSVVFNSGYIPPSGANISVAFDPKEIIF